MTATTSTVEWVRQRGKVRDQLKSIATWEELSILLGDTVAEITCTTKLIPRLSFPDRIPASLASLSEPNRTKTWLAECFVADPAAHISQMELWEIYMLTMDAVPSKHQKLSATSFLNLVPDVIAGARTEKGTPYVVKGMPRWKRRQDAGASLALNASSQGAARQPPVAVANKGRENAEVTSQDNGRSNPLKRKVEVIDLASSP